MNCPECGSQAVLDQKYCRACGATLQITTRPLDASAVSLEPIVNAGADREGQVRRMIGFVRLGTFLMFVGVVIGIIGKMLLHVDAVTVAGVLTAITGIFLVAFPHIMPGRSIRPIATETNAREEHPRVEPTMKLAPGNDDVFVPSATEATTDLLKTPVARSKNS